MERTFVFQKVEDGLPEIDKPVLIRYLKAKKGNWTGKKGEFYTQGYYHEEDHFYSDGKLMYREHRWYDYTDRQILDLDSSSKNKVIEWSYINN